MAVYAKKSNKWVFGREYLQRYHSYRDTRLPVTRFTTEGGYFLKILFDPSKTFLLSLGGSTLVGYETVNRGEKRLYDGATLQDKDAFVDGVAITLETETNRTVLLRTGRERIL